MDKLDNIELLGAEEIDKRIQSIEMQIKNHSVDEPCKDSSKKSPLNELNTELQAYQTALEAVPKDYQ